jgi:hypothetical protein
MYVNNCTILRIQYSNITPFHYIKLLKDYVPFEALNNLSTD